MFWSEFKLREQEHIIVTYIIPIVHESIEYCCGVNFVPIFELHKEKRPIAEIIVV